MNRRGALLVALAIWILLLTGCTSPVEYFLLPDKDSSDKAEQMTNEPTTAGVSIGSLIGGGSDEVKGFDSPEEAVLEFLETIQTGNPKKVVALYPDEAVDYIADKQGKSPEEWREQMESAFTRKAWPFDAYEVVGKTELDEEEISSTYFNGYEPEQAYRVEIFLENDGEELEDCPALYAAKYGEKWYVTPTSW